MSFWANKLNGMPVEQTPLPTTRELYPPFVPQQNIMQQHLPAPQPVYTPTSRTTKGSICPGCGSDKYLGRHGDRAVACGECGYHPRFEQSGYLEPNIRSDEATASRQSGDRQTVQDGLNLLNSGGGDHIKYI